MKTIESFSISEFDRTMDRVFSTEEFRKKLDKGRPLRIKYGVDVTAPFLHLGHAVNLWMMRKLQDRGHVVQFLIGDFTTRIGDPTGKSQTRPILSEQNIERNKRTFLDQAGKILLTDPEVFQTFYNTSWFAQMPLDGFMSLLAMVTHARLIQRDMFQERIQDNKEIFMHEMIYPVLQGYDSVMMESDLTIVGTDQLFNELMGRFYQEKFDQEPQVVITTKITPGLDGREKQSKSLGNYIAVSDSPRNKFGKIMRIPDNLIPSYLEVYTDISLERVRIVENLLDENKINPRDAKLELAHAIVARYEGDQVADREQQCFLNTFSERQVPKDMPKIFVRDEDTIGNIASACLPEESKSAIRRLARQGAIKLDGEKVRDVDSLVQIKEGAVLRIGKLKWFQLSKQIP